MCVSDYEARVADAKAKAAKKHEEMDAEEARRDGRARGFQAVPH
jgi:hypothetical protein